MCTLSLYIYTYTGIDTKSYQNVVEYHLPQMSDTVSNVRMKPITLKNE